MRFPILENRERSSAGTMCVGAVLLFMGSCGWRRRRPPHWPFEFGAYHWSDWLLAGAGLVAFAFGLLQWLRARRDIRAWDAKTSGDWYARATLPRSIFQLLLAVASADGHVDVSERAAIETFLLRRMQKGVVASDLRNWTTTVSRAADPRRLAQHIGRLLDAAEREQLYGWCEEIALADGGIDDDEREVLAAIAQGLQIAAPLASPARTARPQAK
jgi:uncharacterized tellurite resistance protein B-like protein